jgi:non-ribosomal peptide synthetase component F
LAVSQYTGSEDVVFGAVMSGRNASVPYVDEMVGPTLATVPVRIPVNLSSTIASFLQHVQKGASGSTPHEHFGLNNISKTCEGAKTACQFQTMLVIQLKPEAEVREQDSLFGDLVEVENKDSHCLALECVWEGDNLIMEARFNENAISATKMERILHLGKHLVLQLAVANDAHLLSAIDTVSSKDKSSLNLWNSSEPAPVNTEMFHTTAKASAVTMSLPLIRALPSVKGSWKLPKVGPRDLAYLIMTSGSTGKPKGAMIEHRSLITSVEYHSRLYGLHTGSGVLQFASIAFDAAVRDVVASFVHGGCLVVPNQATRMERLMEFINEKKVTWSFFTSSTSRLFQPSDVPLLQAIVVGGEAIAPEMAKLWAGSLHLINGYGPSETTIACTAASVAQDVSN